MTARTIRAGRAEIEATIKDRLGAGLAKLKAKLSSFAASAGAIGAGALGVAAVGLAPLAAGVNQFLKTGDALDKMSARTGAAVEELSTLGYAANITGTDMETLEKGIFGMQRTIRGAERGMATAKDALASIGLELSDLEGLKADEQLRLIAAQLNKVEDAGRRGALAQEIFGRAGRQLMPMLSLGADGIAELQQRARELGIEMSGEDASSAAELTDRLHELKESLKASAVQIGAALAPMLIRAAEGLTQLATGTVNFIRNNRGLVIGVAAGVGALAAFGVGMLAVAAAASIGSIAVGVFIGALSIAGGILGFLASPIGIIAGLLIGGVGAWLYYSGAGGQAVEYLRERLTSLLQWGRKIFGGIQDAIAAGDWASAGRIMWTALRIAWQTGVGWLYGIWLDFKSGFVAVFDQIGQQIRVGWNRTINDIASGILWVADKINAASEAVLGAQLIAIDTDAIRKGLADDARRFEREVGDGLLKRQQDRDAAKNAALAKWDTGGLQRELDGMIQAARDQREAMEAAKAEEEAAAEKPVLADLEEASAALPETAANAIANVGSFNAAAAATFAGRGPDRLEQLQENANAILQRIYGAIKDTTGLTFG